MFRPPLYPAPPPKGATRLERMRFLRKNYLYSGVCLLLVLCFGLILDSTSVDLVACAGLLLQAIGAAVLEMQMRSERRGGA